MRNLDRQNRITRFQTGISIADIAKQDNVTFHTVYAYLWKLGVISNTYLSDEFEAALQQADMPNPVREYPFVKMASPEMRAMFVAPKTRRVREWRTDFAYPWHKLAIEIDGGKWCSWGGAHGADREKRNAYAVIGWRVLYFDTDMLEDPQACVAMVRIALRGSEEER